MIITKKLVRIGHSLGLIIDKSIVSKLKLNKDDWIELDLKKCKEENENEE